MIRTVAVTIIWMLFEISHGIRISETYIFNTLKAVALTSSREKHFRNFLQRS